MKLTVFAVVALASAFACASAAAARAPQWGTVRPLALPAQRGVFLRSVAPNARIDVYVSLPGRHDAELDGFVDALTTPESPWYTRYLTPEQFGGYFGADPGAYAAAVRALQRHGFVIDELQANRTDIVAHATAAQVEGLFGTPLELREDRGRTYYTSRYAPAMPRELAGAVVSGLDDYVQFHPMIRRNPNYTINGSFSFSPDDMATVYSLTSLYAHGLDGKGVEIANATCGAAVPSDLALFAQRFNLPAAQMISTSEPKWAHLSSVCRGTSYGNGESSLDSDWAIAIAREATFHQVVASAPSNRDFDTVYGYIVNTLGHTVHVVTTSWGVCERDIKGSASIKIDQKLFAQAKAEGQHWFSASGDVGTDDCQDGGTAVSVDFPGSSPYVMSVGGTDVQAQIANGNVTAWQAETVWQAFNSNGASGGGRSILYGKPRYQRGATPNDGARDVPDVALLADGVNDGVWLVQNGSLLAGWGGTSESAPMWAGLFAIIEQRYNDQRIADPHARLYQLGRSSSYHRLFHDIVRGNNGIRDSYGTFPGYSATAGFDLATGWGSFIGDALVRAY